MRRHQRRPHESPTSRLREWTKKSGISVNDALEAHGYIVSMAYINQMLSGAKLPGKHFADAFYESTGVRLLR